VAEPKAPLPADAGLQPVESDPVIALYFQSKADPVSAGATMVMQRGGPAQIDALLGALQKALDIPMAPRTGFYYDCPEPLADLLGAVTALRRRGWIITEVKDLTTNPTFHGRAGALTLFLQLGDRNVPTPLDDSWHQIVRANLADPSPVVRESAINAIPVSFTTEWEPVVVQALHDPDQQVALAACRVAVNSGRKSFVPPLAQYLQNLRDSFPSPMSDSVAKALQALGGQMEMLDAWAQRVTDPDTGTHAATRLCFETIDLPIGGSSTMGVQSTDEQRAAMREAWKTFLKKNRALLASGKRVPRDDPSITPALTGLDFSKTPVISIHLKDNTEWPKANPTDMSIPRLPGL
jgi:hypothetical protein